VITVEDAELHGPWRNHHSGPIAQPIAMAVGLHGGQLTVPLSGVYWIVNLFWRPDSLSFFSCSGWETRSSSTGMMIDEGECKAWMAGAQRSHAGRSRRRPKKD